MDDRFRLPSNGPLGLSDGRKTRSSPDLHRRHRQLGWSDIFVDNHALLQMPRPQIRSTADERLLPNIRRILGNATSRATSRISSG